MPDYSFLEPDLSSCKLCEWRCGVDRLNGEVGVCGITIPKVYSSQLHPAPPASFDAFMVGCNFRCLFCQNWPVSMFNEEQNLNSNYIEGYYKPHTWAELGISCLSQAEAKTINADRLFFTGGEPTCSLPWIEEVVNRALELKPGTKVNFDTNGYLSKTSMDRVIEFTTSITYDLKAYDPKLFQALTGANVKPVLRNLKHIVKFAPEKLWEVRVMVIRGIHENDVEDMCKFLVDLDPKIKIHFLAFRPNFVMEFFNGANETLLNHCKQMAVEQGLNNIKTSGITGVIQKPPDHSIHLLSEQYKQEPSSILFSIADSHDCLRKDVYCSICSKLMNCPIRKYIPRKNY
jgi:pyruvate formate lyase activating enzyme